MFSVREEIKRFCQNTSVRGVPRIVRSSEKILQVAWFIVVLICSGALVFFAHGIFTKFYRWPVSTRFGENLKKEIIFPDVTVCSLNRFANVMESSKVKDYFSLIDNMSLYEDKSAIHGFLNSFSALVTFHPKEEMLDSDCPPLISECLLYKQNWQLDRHCTNNFTFRWNAEYHGCYTIRASTLNENGRGMSLVLNNGPPFTSQIPFKSSLTSLQSNGATLIIHTPGTAPDLKTGFSVGCGAENLVRVVQTNVERLGQPYNPDDCTSDEYMFGESGERYSRSMCLEYCMQQEIYELCHCINNVYAVPDFLQDKPFCGNISHLSNKTLDEFINDLICVEMLKTDTESCEMRCGLPCWESRYDYYLTSSPWPPKYYELGVYQNYVKDCEHPEVKKRFQHYRCLSDLRVNEANENGKSCNRNLSDLDEIGKSFVVVKLFVVEDYPFTLVDKPSYAWSDMVGLVGGMLSLWMGISVATVMEVLELFYYIVKGCFKRKIKVNPPPK